MRVLSALLAVAFVVVLSLLVRELRADSQAPSLEAPSSSSRAHAHPAAVAAAGGEGEAPKPRGPAPFGAVPTTIIGPPVAPSPRLLETVDVPAPQLAIVDDGHDTSHVLDVAGGADDDDGDDVEDQEDVGAYVVSGLTPKQAIVNGPHEVVVNDRIIYISSELLVF